MKYIVPLSANSRANASITVLGRLMGISTKNDLIGRTALQITFDVSKCWRAAVQTTSMHKYSKSEDRNILYLVKGFYLRPKHLVTKPGTTFILFRFLQISLREPLDYQAIQVQRCFYTHLDWYIGILQHKSFICRVAALNHHEIHRKMFESLPQMTS